MSILKPFIIPLGFTATATICFLMILKNCLRGYLLCQQLSWQNFSFYFVLNLDTGPYYVRSINHTDDNIVHNVAYKTNFKNRNKQQQQNKNTQRFGNPIIKRIIFRTRRHNSNLLETEKHVCLIFTVWLLPLPSFRQPDVHCLPMKGS